ncbi:shikimate kinase [Novosphingobium umbonatum]|nr:shikimate kinase [Novosphingobium umbonatum]
MDEEHTLSEAARQADQARLEAVIARLDRPIVLVGMMGVGKSSLGKRLAAALGVAFIDADDEIERAAQMSIPDIFSTYGETFFRDGERRVIARLLGVAEPAAKGLSLPPVLSSRPEVKVIATGGGAFVNDATRSLILARSIAVWLDAELDTLVERTARKGNRPLLRQGNPREILSNLKSSREPFYAQAPIKVMSRQAPHAKTLSCLMEAIEAWLDEHHISLPTHES